MTLLAKMILYTMASQETSLLFCSNGNFLSLHPSSSSKRAISQTIASPPKSFLTQVSHGKIIFRCFDRRFVWASSICDIHTWTQSYNSKTKQKNKQWSKSVPSQLIWRSSLLVLGPTSIWTQIPFRQLPLCLSEKSGLPNSHGSFVYTRALR